MYLRLPLLIGCQDITNKSASRSLPVDEISFQLLIPVLLVRLSQLDTPTVLGIYYHDPVFWLLLLRPIFL